MLCLRGETDITTVFGTVIGGSNPSGDTNEFKLESLLGFERAEVRLAQATPNVDEAKLQRCPVLRIPPGTPVKCPVNER